MQRTVLDCSIRLYIHSEPMPCARAHASLSRMHPQDHKDARIEFTKGKIRQALLHAWVVLCPAVHVTVHYTSKGGKQTVSHVTCDGDHKHKGDLVLVPVTPLVQHSAKVPTSGVDLKLTVPDPQKPGKSVYFYLNPKVEFPEAVRSGGPFMAPFWTIAAAPDSTLANMQPDVLKVQLNSVLTIGKQKFDGASASVDIPVLVNSKPIKKGDKLCKAGAFR